MSCPSNAFTGFTEARDYTGEGVAAVRTQDAVMIGSKNGQHKS
jgi:hypothetical protein